MKAEQQIQLTFPQTALAALKMAPEQAALELRMAAAVKLYELSRLSSGAAAELAGISKPLFLTRLADYGVSTFSLSEEEIAGETRLAQGCL